MNYIKELNAFREWLLVHDLSSGPITLWHTLMSINNVARWRQRFNAPYAIVGQLSGLSKQGIVNARKVLVEHGLLSYQVGRKGKAPIYEMYSLVNNIGDKMDASTSEPLTIRKQKQNKNKQEGEEADDCAMIYEQNIGTLTPLNKDTLLAWAVDLGNDMVLEAIRRAGIHGGRTFGYVEKMLRDWKAAQLDSCEAVVAYEQHKYKNRKHTVLFKPHPEDKSVFTALREEVGR